MAQIVKEKPLEAKQDTIDELKRLMTLTENNQAKIYLQREVDRQELSLENQKKIEELANSIEIKKQSEFKEAKKVAEIVKKQGFKRKNLTTYSWDQSDKRLKFYLKNCKNVSETNKLANNDPAVKVIYDANDKISVLAISETDKMEYNFNIPTLFDELNQTAATTIKVKKDYIFVSLAKTMPGHWEHLTKTDKKVDTEKKEKMANFGGKDGEGDPQKMMMDMMKNMYNEGDDEMKRTINKAWEQSQNRKNAGGMPDLGDLGM